MSPSTAQAPATEAADVRQAAPSKNTHSKNVQSKIAQSTTGPAWPDTVANPRRTRVR